MYRFKEEDGVKNAKGITFIRLEKANALLAKWESDSQKIAGCFDKISKSFKQWTVKGPVVLKTVEGYSHMACVWNPRPLDEAGIKRAAIKKT